MLAPSGALLVRPAPAGFTPRSTPVSASAPAWSAHSVALPVLELARNADGDQGVHGRSTAGRRCNHTARIAAAAAAAGAVFCQTQRHGRETPSQRDRARIAVAARRDQYFPGKESPRGRLEESLDFGDIKLVGPAANYVLEMRNRYGEFKPLKIQELAMKSIYDGVSCVIQSPTGTGKSLAFLLPLLQRLHDEGLSIGALSNPARQLYIVPASELAVQLCGTIRQIVGRERALTVLQVRFDMDNSNPSASIIVATPKQLLKLLEDPATRSKWLEVLSCVDTVVVDEADFLLRRHGKYERKRRNRQGKVEPMHVLLDTLAATKKGIQADWQLVAASATMPRDVKRALKFTSGLNLDFFHVLGGDAPVPSREMGKNDNRMPLLPPGLKHYMRPMRPDWNFNSCMDALERTIRELQPRRALVVLSFSPQGPYATRFGINVVTAQLRYRTMGMGGYMVDTIKSYLKRVAELWADDPLWDTGADEDGGEVLVSELRSIRGVHMDDCDCVILLGEFPTIIEYVHLAGRTARCQLSRKGESSGGTVVALVSDGQCTRLYNNSKLWDFTTHEYPDDVPLPAIPREGGEGHKTKGEKKKAPEEELLEWFDTQLETNPAPDDSVFSAEAEDKTANAGLAGGAWG